jgi:hypothetical protein
MLGGIVELCGVVKSDYGGGAYARRRICNLTLGTIGRNSTR